MNGIRVLLANEPRAYRETLAAALRYLRPHHEVVDRGPDGLNGDLARLQPHLVVGSDIDHPPMAELLAWILLYPRGEAHVVVCVGSEQRIASDLTLEELLAVVDQTERLAHEPPSADVV